MKQFNHVHLVIKGHEFMFETSMVVKNNYKMYALIFCATQNN